MKLSWLNWRWWQQKVRDLHQWFTDFIRGLA